MADVKLLRDKLPLMHVVTPAVHVSTAREKKFPFPVEGERRKERGGEFMADRFGISPQTIPEGFSRAKDRLQWGKPDSLTSVGIVLLIFI